MSYLSESVKNPAYIGRTESCFSGPPGQMATGIPKPASPVTMQISRMDAQISELNTLVAQLIEKASPVMQGDPRNAVALSGSTEPAAPMSCPMEGDLANLYSRLNSTTDTLRSAIHYIQL